LGAPAANGARVSGPPTPLAGDRGVSKRDRVAPQLRCGDARAQRRVGRTAAERMRVRCSLVTPRASCVSR